MTAAMHPTAELALQALGWFAILGLVALVVCQLKPQQPHEDGEPTLHEAERTDRDTAFWASQMPLWRLRLAEWRIARRPRGSRDELRRRAIHRVLAERQHRDAA